LSVDDVLHCVIYEGYYWLGEGMTKCAECGAKIDKDTHVCGACGGSPNKPPPKSNLIHFGFFLGLCTFFFAVPFSLLRAGTTLSTVAAALISVPAGALLFYIAVQLAKM
jgi:hypothetical protein